MPLLNDKEISLYLNTRKETLQVIKDYESDAKNYYQKLIDAIDHFFNDNDPDLKEGIKEMMEELISKKAKDSIQLLSFCIIESGDYSIRLSAFETVNDERHDVANYYFEDLDDVFNDIFSSEYVDKYDLELDDFWTLPYMKKIMQIQHCLKEFLTEYDLSLLNIKYPLYVYLDYEETDPCSGTLVTKIDS